MFSDFYLALSRIHFSFILKTVNIISHLILYKGGIFEHEGQMHTLVKKIEKCNFLWKCFNLKKIWIYIQKLFRTLLLRSVNNYDDIVTSTCLFVILDCVYKINMFVDYFVVVFFASGLYKNWQYIRRTFLFNPFSWLQYLS